VRILCPISELHSHPQADRGHASFPLLAPAPSSGWTALGSGSAGRSGDAPVSRQQLASLRGRNPASFSASDGRLEIELVAAALKGRT